MSAKRKRERNEKTSRIAPWRSGWMSGFDVDISNDFGRCFSPLSKYALYYGTDHIYIFVRLYLPKANNNDRWTHGERTHAHTATSRAAHRIDWKDFRRREKCDMLLLLVVFILLLLSLLLYSVVAMVFLSFSFFTNWSGDSIDKYVKPVEKFFARIHAVWVSKLTCKRDVLN